MINITRRALGVLVIKPAKGGAQFTVNAAGKPAQIKVRLDIARQGPPGPTSLISADSNNRTTLGLDGGIFTPEIVVDPLAYYILAKA